MTSSIAATNPISRRVDSVPATLGLWERISLSLAYLAARSLLACLTLSGFYHFARAFGTLEWLINHRRRRRFTKALTTVLGRTPTRKERRRLTREFFMQSRCDKLFYLVFDRIDRDKALTLLAISDRALLDEAVARGHGVYIALSHHGALHVIAMLLALHGYKTAGVRDAREGALRRYVQNRLDRRYVEFQRLRVIAADRFPREIYRCLRDGYILGSAMDVSRIRRPTQKVEWVNVFGQRRPFLTGPLRIALRCGTPVLQAFVVPGPGFRYRLEIVEVLWQPGQQTDEAEAVSRAITVYAANVERHLRESPSLLTRV